ncbi:tRNA (adenosine(37)-N6)-dimethylallyltransferase MiaA [uncultured Desulfosarcina sp.]|uniref:tRNA (adenosine(37)-N6)-dimethylallyltransferase MiaA n=1 Tax=uncultured Desulfosarcina sp. TaxID=218289 RepID=UPI0029C8C083|nr:tRNA (adenosine(37)-N6)-dimethylallyltransferase MiaA [uncultured Desulfosarcina sp.]
MTGASKNRIVVVCGPTGSGKTGLAIGLAQQFDGEIVGADSMQIYRYMDIGTAKPTPAEQARATHHMIDIVDPDEDFDAAMYADAAGRAIDDIVGRGRLPLVVGGTGFYIKALVYGLFEEGPSDPEIRSRLKEAAQSEGSAALHRRLAGLDSRAAAKIHPNDAYRIVRALEVFEITGRPLSDFQQRHRFQDRRFDALFLGVTWPRPILYDRIDRRVDRMMGQGLEAEVRGLLARGYGPRLKSMQSLGYRHLAAFINGETRLDETVRTLKRDHRRYAKRQLTWFRADPAVHWMTPDAPQAAVDRIGKFLAV